MKSLNPFHLAIPVSNLEVCRAFYRDILKCNEGRSSPQWVDFNFYGHQLVIHQSSAEKVDTIINKVDGKHVPVPHSGVVLTWTQFEELSAHLNLNQINFIIAPYIR